MQIPNNQRNADITLTPVNDSEVENTESVVLTLVPEPVIMLVPPDNATVNIEDNDLDAISIDNVSMAEGDSGHD